MMVKSEITQAVIFAGGLGNRLHPLTLTTPKPLIRIGKKPFLEYIIILLKENGIKEIVILVGYLGYKIEEYFKTGKDFGVNITYSYSPVDYDTGSRIRDARHLLSDTFLLLYCDNYWPLKLNDLVDFYKNSKKESLMTIYENSDKYTQNNVLVNQENLVIRYDKSKKAPRLNGVDIGFFILRKSSLKYLPKRNFSFEKVILPRLIREKELVGYRTSNKYYGLSNLSRIPEIKKFFREKKVIFLDRDGVINQKPDTGNYITSWEKFIFIQRSKLALKKLTDNKYEIYIITNQAGVGRGHMTLADLRMIHKCMIKELLNEGIIIKDIYFCPHSTEDECYCRKPKPGMLFDAARDHSIDLTRSIFIGDDNRDMDAGKSAGCNVLLVKNKKDLLSIVNQIIV